MTASYRRILLLWFGIVAGAATLASILAPRAWGFPVSEFEVKAAYLYNFARFVQWPPNSSLQGNEFPICVLGRDPFGAVLDSTLAGEKIDGRSVVSRRVSTVDEAAGCRELFIGSSEIKRLTDILSTAGKMNMLTVSDLPRFVDEGGMVQFTLTENHVRFAINMAAARQAGLTLSSELLKVATEVRGKPRPGD